MKAYIFILLYGMAGIIGFFLSAFWGTVARKRRRQIAHKWYKDRYYIIAASVSLLSGGQAIVDVSRAVGNVLYGLSPILLRSEGYFIVFGLVLLIVGLLGMVWLADMEAHPFRPVWLKRAGIFTLIWAFALFFINLYVPLTPYVPPVFQEPRIINLPS